MKNNIFPCLWFDGNGREAADYYTRTFGGKIMEDTFSVLTIDLFGQKMMMLNAGPQFPKNASVSFMVLCETPDEVDRYWKSLSQDGMVLMEVGEYAWSKRYGWVRDRFGVTWQLYMGEKRGQQKIIPTLMFLHRNNGKALEAMKFYTSVFPGSSIGEILTYGEGVGNETHEIPENIQHAHFELDGFSLFCMDSSYEHKFDFNEGISLVIMTENQQQTDRYWDALSSHGGTESHCGWLKDRFGLSWQVIPERLIELINSEDLEKSQRAVEAMLKMRRIIISDLEKAAGV